MESVDKEVIYKRLNKLRNEILYLKKYDNMKLEEYLENNEIQIIVERKLQIICQIMIDIAKYIITRERLEYPEEEENVFIILARNKIISDKLADNLKEMVRFRNILVHNYLEIEHKLVYKNLRKKDSFIKFAEQIISYVEK